MSADDQSVPVRPFEPRDIDAVNDILTTHRPWTEYETRFELDVEDFAETGTALVAAIDGSIAGIIWWLPTGAFGLSGYLKLLGVHQGYQSAGVGTALMDAMESAVIDDAGVSDIFLLVSGFNDSARGFYAQRGYVEIGPIENYVENGIDEVLMRKTTQDC